MNPLSKKGPLKKEISVTTKASDRLLSEKGNAGIENTVDRDKALKNSGDLLRYIIEHTHGGVAVHDRDLKYIYVSRKYLEDYRLTDMQVIGRHHYDVFPELPEKWKEVHKRVLTGEVHKSDCDPYLTPWGSLEYTRWECRPWYETDGTIGGIIVYTEIITEIVKEREALRENQEIFRHFMENSPVYIFFKDKDIRPIYLSRNYEKMLGMPVGNILGKTMNELFPSELAVNMIEDDKKVLKSGELIVVDEELAGRYYTTFKFPIIMDGEPRYLAGYTLDITERKVAEKKLGESNQALTRLIGNLSGIVYRCRFEPDWPMEFISQGCYQMTGYRENDFYTGRVKWGSLIHEEDSLRVWKEITRNIKKNRPFQLEYRINGRHGRKRWVWEKGCGVFDKDGNVIAIEGFITDVTERRETENALKEVIVQRNRDEKLQQILYEIARTSVNSKDIAHLLVTIKDELSRVLDTSGFFAALYDENEDCLRKLALSGLAIEIIPCDMNNSPCGAVIRKKQTLLLNKSDLLNYKDFRENYPGKHYPECWLGVPMVNDGRAIGLIVLESPADPLAFDGNSIRLVEMIAHELAIVFQRNRMVEDLILAKDKAEESDRLKTAFLENISHEIRTPMNGILGFMNLLSKPDLSEEKREKYIQVVNESGSRLMATINNIIEISKIESGQIEVNYSTVNINEVIDFHLDFFSQQASLKGVKLKAVNSRNASGVKLLTDKHMLDGIFTNLLKNAIKFTSSGTIQLGYYPEGDSVVFYVKDSGIGIHQDKLDMIFDRFVQADQNLTRTYEGSGLGLSIVKGYVNALNGKIWVESEYGNGSTFYFSLPYNRAEGTDNPPQSAGIDFVKGNGLVILIAEDDPVSFKFLETILDGPSTTILHADSGDDAVKLVKEHPEISLVLMDIKMPGMNGLQATEEIRKFNRGIPIIAQTAHAFAEDKKKALAAGCNEYLSKPIRYNELVEVINRYIKSKHS